MKDNNGLQIKYRVTKAHGEPVNGFCFVLRTESSDEIHNEACRKAILTYAENIKEHLPQLAEELIIRFDKKLNQ